MTLPNIEDILTSKMNQMQGKLSGVLLASTAKEAMKEYARQVLDYVEEEVSDQLPYTGAYGVQRTILKIKDEL